MNIHTYSRSSAKFFVDALLATSTASSLFEYDAKSLAYLSLGSFDLFVVLFKLHQVGWQTLVPSHFHMAPEMFSWVQVLALAGSLKDIQKVVLKPLL